MTTLQEVYEELREKSPKTAAYLIENQDLSRFVTKEDLKELATKADFKLLATKEELYKFKDELTKEINSKFWIAVGITVTLFGIIIVMLLNILSRLH